MQNQFRNHNTLPIIWDLKKQRTDKLDYLINNLKIDNVRDDDKFKQSIDHIISTTQIAPIKFEEPKYVDHEYTRRELSITQQMMGLSSDVYTHTIAMAFTGDSVLFDYRPMATTISSNDHGILVNSGNQFRIYVELPSINPQQAIANAKEIMGMTVRYATDNSADIANWNKEISVLIEQRATAKRDELISIFGK